ncbi:MAG: hypothetical protein IJ446_08325 [Oscillospiraceae bacterium]|nr:hypothetical protein [Oscillospiraceae bacterium]
MKKLTVNDSLFDKIFERQAVKFPVRYESRHDEFTSGSIILIGSGEKAVAAKVLLNEKYGSTKDIPSDRLLYLPDDDLSDSCITLFRIEAFPEDKPTVTAVVPVTMLLYRYILRMRHLQLKKVLFRNILSAEDRHRLDDNISLVLMLTEYLDNKFDKETLCSEISYKDKGDDFFCTADIIGLIKLCGAPPVPDELTKRLMEEISDSMNRITECIEKKQFEQIRQIAYDIHNLPEMIRTKNDWR